MRMDKEPLPQRQSSNLYGCMGSPSWFPANRQQHQHSKFHLLRHAGASINGSRSRSRSWREALKRFIKEGRNLYSSKPITFGYDAVSYAKNFDDGCWKEGPATSSSSSCSLRRSFDDFECQVNSC